MSDRFVFRRARPDDLPGIHKLFKDTQFLSSGPAKELSEDEFSDWLDNSRSYPLVVCPADDPDRVIGHAQLCSKPTASRGRRAELEDVVVHPSFFGHDLGNALMGRLIWFAQNVWRATRIEWVSENTKKRQRARAMYVRLGAVRVRGSNSDYRLRLPYTPPEHMFKHFVEVVS